MNLDSPTIRVVLADGHNLCAPESDRCCPIKGVVRPTPSTAWSAFPATPGGERAVIWTADGTPAELPPVPGARSSRANDISARDDVAGAFTGDAGDRPVFWTAWAGPSVLPLIDGDSTGEARALNAGAMGGSGWPF